MTLLPLDVTSSTPDLISKQPSWERLLGGEILLEMRSHSAWGGAVTAQMYLPLKQAQAWQQLTNYPRWVNYFPDLTHSEVLHTENTLHRRYKYLYQAARKSFFTLSAQVEVYLQVEEVDQQTIEFRL